MNDNNINRKYDYWNTIIKDEKEAHDFLKFLKEKQFKWGSDTEIDFNNDYEKYYDHIKQMYWNSGGYGEFVICIELKGNGKNIIRYSDYERAYPPLYLVSESCDKLNKLKDLLILKDIND